MIQTCTYHVEYKTIFCRFLTCDPWMAWYIHVLIMLTIRQSSVGSWDMWSMNGMIHTCTYHVDYKTIFCRFLRHVIHEWHNTYLYLSCWLEDNLLWLLDMCSMIHTFTYHLDYKTIFCDFLTCVLWYIPLLIMLTIRQSSVTSWHVFYDTYLYLSCWL